ncbi:hypothetical protein BDZ89DRAFT_898971, partial [Hymenopellis radicata]
HRQAAREAIAHSQAMQAKYYNRGRKPANEIDVGKCVLINPHALEWVESTGKGAKFTQRWIGPFEVTEKVFPTTFWLRLSNQYPGIFNVAH